MTDITDQDKRDARKWADRILEHNTPGSAIGNAARVVLATVDAPEPTLADEIRGLPDFTMSGDNCINDCHERADDVAFRVEQMEHDLAEARAEVERLTAERVTEPSPTLNDGSMTRPATVAREENVYHDLPDPDDVPYGEAWLVELKGCRHTAVRVPGRYWWVWRSDSGYAATAWCSDITLVSRLVPAPRQVTTWEELDALALYTVIRGANEAVCEKGRQRPGCAPQWFQVGIDESESAMITLPATVLWEPEVAS